MFLWLNLTMPKINALRQEPEVLAAESDALKHLRTETATELEALLPAILDRAFKGEL